MIEKARLEDCDEIYDLMCILENQKLDYDHFKQTYHQGINSNDVIYLVYRQDKILGFLAFRFIVIYIIIKIQEKLWNWLFYQNVEANVLDNSYYRL